jgi:TolB protein
MDDVGAPERDVGAPERKEEAMEAAPKRRGVRVPLVDAARHLVGRRRWCGMGKSMRRGIVLAVVGLAALPLAPANGDSPFADAASSGDAEGRIVFDSDRGGHVDLWVMNPDGSGQQRITDDKIEDLFPSWSPDGSQIVWARGGRGPSAEIWVMNADGSGPTQLTFNQFPDLNPKWSPDGSKIVFRSQRQGNTDIYVMNSDGTGEQRLTTDPGFDFVPDWSPDGTRIAFARDVEGVCAIYTMFADGTGEQKITADSFQAGVPRWNPDGSRIMFADSFCALTESDIFTVNPDGTGLTQITDTPENEIGDGWSPFGDRVAANLARLDPGRPGPGHLHKADIAIVDMATGAVNNATETEGVSEGHPHWSPA